MELDESQDPDTLHHAFMAANKAILERAQQLVDETGDVERMLAVLLWDGGSCGTDDLTDHFRREAKARGARLAEVSTTD